VDYDKQLIKDTMLIPNGVNEWNAELYELTGYINNINTQNTQVLMEYSTKGYLGNIYDYGVQRNSATNLDRISYYNYDGRGSVSEIVSANAKTVMSYSYSAFGESTIRYSGYVKNPYRYNAEYVDWVPGIPDFQYLRARYYTPYEGRFINQDTLFGDVQVPLTQNLYAYCGNNAVNMIDPSGRSLEIIMGLEGQKKSITNEIDSLRRTLANLQGYAKMEIQGKIDSLLSKIKSFNAEIDSQKRLASGNATKVDIDNQAKKQNATKKVIDKINNVKIEADRELKREEQTYKEDFEYLCDSPYEGFNPNAIKILKNPDFLFDQVTTTEKYKILILMQFKNKSTLETYGRYNELTSGDLASLGIKNLNDNWISSFNMHARMAWRNSSVGEAEFFAMQKMQASQQYLVASAATSAVANRMTKQNQNTDEAFTMNTKQESTAGSSSGGIGRSANKLKPDGSAGGAHSVFKRDPNTGKITNYKTYNPNPKNPTGYDENIGYDGVGRTHINKVTGESLIPHVHDKAIPGGVRIPYPHEIPK